MKLINYLLIALVFVSSCKEENEPVPTFAKDYGEGTASNAAFPDQPIWFQDARGFSNLEKGLKTVGFDENEIKLILGNNWFNFYKDYIN